SLRLDSNPVICDFEMKMAVLIVEGADGDFSTCWREFHCVVDQVPKHLLKPNTIRQYVMPLRLQPGRNRQFFPGDAGAGDFNRIANDRMRVATFPVKMKFAARNASKIEQIVDQ